MKNEMGVQLRHIAEIRITVYKPKRDHFSDLGIGWRIKPEQILQKQDVTMWTGFI